MTLLYIGQIARSKVRIPPPATSPALWGHSPVDMSDAKVYAPQGESPRTRISCFTVRFVLLYNTLCRKPTRVRWPLSVLAITKEMVTLTRPKVRNPPPLGCFLY